MITAALLFALTVPVPQAPGANAKPVGDAALALALAAQDPFESVLLDRPGDGNLWAVGQDWKASFGPDGTTFHPFLGPDAPRAEFVRFDVTGMSVSGEPLHLRSAEVTESSPSAVTLDRGAALERYHLRVREIEQTFVFETLPTRGAIEVLLELDTTMAVIPGVGAGLDFYNERGVAMSYSGAIAYDSRGRRCDVALRRTSEGLALTVPAAFVERAALPLTIDPVISTGDVASEAYAEYEPDVSFFADFDRWVVSYHRYFNAADTDVYVRTVTLGGAVSSPVIIDATLDVWSNARVAGLTGSSGGLVVASVVPDDPATEDGVIRGRRMALPFLTPGPTFDISESGTGSNLTPAISANNSGAPNARYLVTWVRDFSPIDGDIHARLVAGDGTPSGLSFVIENSGADDDRSLAASPSLGASNGDFLLAWERGGDVWARRIGPFGSLVGRPAYLAMVGGRRPSVSSFMNKTIAGFPVAGIAAEITVQPPMGPQNQSVGLVLVDENDGVGRRFDLSAMEDWMSDGHQSQPTIVADDSGFILGYAETYSPGDDDIHMLSGAVTVSPTGAEPALAERHGTLDNSVSNESQPAFASRWDGDGVTTLAFGVWQDGDTAASDIESGVMVIGYMASTPPVGVQSDVCRSNPNSEGVAGWMVIGGDQSTTAPKTLFCVNLPRNTFGAFATSMTVGFAPNPGGSAGNLCLGGQIGRLSTAVFTGPDGVMEQPLSMVTLPSPGGSVATAPGQRWYFQAWHRDAIGGMATSNFSGVASIVFD